LLFAPRSDCFSIVQILVPSLQPFELRLPPWYATSIFDKSCPFFRAGVLHTKRAPWEQSLAACSRFEVFADQRGDTTTRADNFEAWKAANFQQAPDPWIIYGQDRFSTTKVNSKPRHGHEVPALVEKLEGLKCIIGGLLPPTDGEAIFVRYIQPPDFTQEIGILTRAALEEGNQGAKVIKLKGSANGAWDRRLCVVRWC
jgi:hypothetical protein